MDDILLTEADLRQLAGLGISPDKGRAQLALLKRGVEPLRLNRPCTPGDGLVVIPEGKLPGLVALHDTAAQRGRFMKFVPASGAASRMFAHWHIALTKAGYSREFASAFAGNLRKFAFFPDLKEAMARQGQDVEDLLHKGEFSHILHFILTSRGLNYGHLPKALLKFHASREGNRTALEEHLVEAAFTVTNAQNECPIHFTVSEEHRKQISSFLSTIKKDYEKHYGITFRIGLSSQSASTDTMALEGEELYRDHAGRLILRPGGHGSLLDNLNALAGDIVFIKNIDNVVPDRLKTEVVFYKKVLGGYFLSLEKEIYRHLRKLSGQATERDIGMAKLFCQKKLHVVPPPLFENWPPAKQGHFLAAKLHRPLRVCGMVKNAGEPGGGPFWIEAAGQQSLQIVESQQIDSQSGEQRAIWSASTHFNPVDLVCGLRDYRGEKFDLPAFADPTAVTLAKKIEKGRHITVLEHPGLWNGSMANWNTAFVEVPNSTFNPVKTIDDLLRPQHLPENDQ